MLILPALVAPLLAAPAAPVHCQVPCGIYGDHLRVELLREDAATIEKAMAEIDRLGKETPTNFNQVVRWITTKDEHAQRIQDQLAAYWLAQRVKKPSLDDESDEGKEARRRYSVQLVSLHEMTVAAMKCKQTTDPSHVATFRRSLDSFRKAYFSPEDLEHLDEHHEKEQGGGGGTAEAATPEGEARRDRARSDLKLIARAISSYRIDNAGRYPASLEDLVSAGHLEGGTAPRDPWGNEYVFEAPLEAGGEVRLMSLGADGKIGGSGDAADVSVR